MAAAAWIVPVAIAGAAMMQQNRASYQAQKAAMQTGVDQREAKYFEAKQLDALAGQELAAGQRAAANEERKGEIMASRALALSASSGASASDPTVITLLGGIGGEAAYRSSVALYDSKVRARNLRISASAARMEGETAKKTGQQVASGYSYQAQARNLETTSTLFSRYYDRAFSQPGARQPAGDQNLVDQTPIDE